MLDERLIVPSQPAQQHTDTGTDLGRGLGRRRSASRNSASAAVKSASATTAPLSMLTNDRMTPLFKATALATEAAITNALLAAETTTGANEVRVHAMPVDRMLAIMRKYGRLP